MSLKTVARRAGIKKRSPGNISRWFTIPNIALTAQSKTHVLVINVIQHSETVWAAAALTTPLATGGEAEQVFENHAHEVIGEFTTEAKVKRAGEAYAKKWLRSQRELEKCACEPMENLEDWLRKPSAKKKGKRR